jgi:hypothetical protein
VPDDHEINPLRKISTGLAGRDAAAFSMGWLGFLAKVFAFFLPHKKHEFNCQYIERQLS